MQVPVVKINPSLIQVPIEVPMHVFQQELNKHFKGLIYNDSLYENNDEDNLKVKIWRTKKSIQVDGYKQKIRFMFPLEIWAQYRWQACGFCPVIEKSTMFDIDLTLNTQVQISRDWGIITTTTFKDMFFSKEPILDFGVVQIPVTRLIRGLLTANMPTITAAVDREVTTAIPLKLYVEDAWKKLQEPVLLDSAYQAWLVMKPVNMFLTPLQCDPGKLVAQAGMEVYLETKVGTQPEEPLKTFLGPPVIKEKLTSQFNVELPIQIDFDAATRIARKNLKDSIFTVSKNKKIRINDIEIYGKSGFVFIRADLDGNFKGIIYFKGIPSYDSLTRSIYLKDFDFELNTKNALYTFASWLLHGSFKKTLDKYFSYSIAKDIEGTRLALKKLLQGYTYDKYFKISGDVDQLALKNVFCDDQGIQALLVSSGTAVITFLNFTP
ncbi:MAG: DUF4403 family protein [Flavobacteriales bacterium]|nr:DUF4403 family protein [Flavobacteriales bacterium]